MIEIREERAAALGEYARVPIAFDVQEVLEPELLKQGLDGVRLIARAVSRYVKDYDEVPGNHPTEWAARFDMSRWGILSAWAEGVRVGGTVVAWGTPGVDLLEGRSDLAVLWDIRVAPPMRGEGIGAALFQAAERWAAGRGARWLKVETQNVNVDACRFYARQGCTLGGVNRFAYPDLPGEVQLLWYKELSGPRVAL